MNEERLLKILIAPHISEKSIRIADSVDNNKQIVFKVSRDCAKPEIKKAVELIFDVKVKSVAVANVNGKKKRFGAIQGNRKSWKKAYVTLDAGQDIDFSGVE